LPQEAADRSMDMTFAERYTTGLRAACQISYEADDSSQEEISPLTAGSIVVGSIEYWVVTSATIELKARSTAEFRMMVNVNGSFV
jgi:hypothetical protein